MASKLTLLVPGLLQPAQSLQGLPAGEKPVFELLNRFFRRASQTHLPVKGLHATLFHLFGIETDAQGDYPVAALTRLADANERDDAWYLRCDPAYIHADMDRAILLGHGALGLSLEETEQLLTILNAHVEQDGWRIEAHAVDRWYVSGAGRARVTTTPPGEVLGKDIKFDLPRGNDGAYWCAVLNECQMLLHELPLNQQRQARGLLPVNSLWFWGGGQLPGKAVCQYDQVYGNDPLLQGLAIIAGCAYGGPDDVWQTIQQHDGHCLLVIDELISPAIGGDLFAWLDAVKQFEQGVMQKILALLKAKQLTQFELLSADGRVFQMTPAMLRHWWKRRPTFLSLIERAGD